MISALFYLQWHSFRNRLVSRFKRLRQPKYLIGALVGGLYFYSYFFRFLFVHGARSATGFLSGPEYLPLIESGGALVLLLVVLIAWIFPGNRAALHFTEAEVAFLFPAPVSRRGLIQWKIIRSQLAILTSSLILTLVSRRFGGNVLTHALGWWLILSTLNLHFIASSFARTMLLDRGFSNLWRRVVTLGVVAGLVVFIWLWARNTLPPLPDPDTADSTTVLNYAEQVLTSGPALYLLYPFRLVVRPFLAPDAAVFAVALIPALLIYLLHYVWVVQSGVAFEEASVIASQRMAAALTAIRSGRRIGGNQRTKPGRPWFRLAPTGPAPVALVWKNLLGIGRVLTIRLMITLLILVVVFGGSFFGTTHQHFTSLAAATIIAIGLGYSLLLGPQILRLDFRADLPLADILKTYPLPGWQIALGEILAPVVMLAGFQWLLLLLGLGLIFLLPLQPQGLYLAIVCGAALLLPALDGLLLIIPNAAAVVFPAWVQTGKDSPRGIEVMGQRIILGIAQLLVVALALVPAAAVFAGIFFVVKLALNPAVAILPAAVAATIIVVAEAALGIVWLGKCFERFDVAEDPAT